MDTQEGKLGPGPAWTERRTARLLSEAVPSAGGGPVSSPRPLYLVLGIDPTPPPSALGPFYKAERYSGGKKTCHPCWNHGERSRFFCLAGSLNIF